MNITKQQLLYGTGFILAGLFLGWLLFSGPDGQEEHPDHEQLSQEELEQHVLETHTDEEGNIVYTCSMHPQIREEEPGNCPICGMELIPVGSEASEVRADDYSIVMTEVAMRLGDIQTSPVIRGIPEKQIDLPGRIKVDERRLTNVTTHFPGRILDTKVDFTGAPIRKGEPMVSVYSPELVSAQRELFEAARQKERNPRLYESTRQKFLLWEFSDEQIDEIESRGEIQREIEILSPVNGFVLSRNVADEQYVGEGTVIYEVANLDHLWVVLEAYEEDVNWISTGDLIRFSPRSNPGQNYEATVTYIDPFVNPMMRTVGIRADVENFDHRLKPDMLVRGTLQAGLESEKLMVPVSSVLWTGQRSLLYVKDTSVDVPRFEVREVELGVRAGDYYVIEEGVEEGEEVVFHGAFRIDSEMQLADRFSMMNREPGSGAVPVHNHGGMEMDDDMDMEMEDHSEHVPDEFEKELTGLVETYLLLKDALLESNPEQATEIAGRAADQLQSIGEHRLKGDAMDAWMQTYQQLMEPLNSIKSASNMEEIKTEFDSLSGVLIEAVQTFGIEGVVYHQYCPMEDASWLSSKEQIHNPYMSETMPDCGEIIDRIEFN